MKTCLINSHRLCCMSECKEAVRGNMSETGWHSALKQRRACFWALRGYQDPENGDQRRKLSSIMEPKLGCLVCTSDRNLVCTRHGAKLAVCLYLIVTTSRQLTVLTQC